MEETNIHSFKFQLGAQTNVGCVRTNNEDNFVVSTDLSSGEWLLPRDSQTLFTLGNRGAMLVVADGMGGLDAGEIASQIAVDTVRAVFSPDRITDEILENESAIRKYMCQAVTIADQAIKERSKTEKGIKSMGTTLAIAWLQSEFANIAWCGDSRIYRFCPVSGLTLVTKDHSYVQELVDSGRLLPEYAFDHPDNNIITRSLGNPQKIANPDFVRMPLREGESLLLCTDGLNSMLRDEEIESIMQDTVSDVEQCTTTLVRAALELGGHDNVTVVLCRIIPGEKEDTIPEMQQTLSTFQEKKTKKTWRKTGYWMAGLLFITLLSCLAWFFSANETGQHWKNKIIHWYGQTVK